VVQNDTKFIDYVNLNCWLQIAEPIKKIKQLYP